MKTKRVFVCGCLAVILSLFCGCSSISGANADSGNSVYTDENGVVYNREKTILLRAPEEITGVTIPEGVTKISDAAFSNCTSLTSIIIPASVTYIGAIAFSSCTSLAGITIPSGVTFIGSNAFIGCTSLAGITVDGSNDNYSSEGGIFYNKEKTILIKAPSAGISGAVSIPASVTIIDNNAFADCTKITSVTIPAGVTSIGEKVFFYCTGLTGVTIPESVTSIGDNAFSGCSNLAKVTIPAGVTTVGQNAFYDCKSITSITIPAGVMAVGQHAFYGWQSGQTINVMGHASQLAADSAFNSGRRESWRYGCDARINYLKG